MRNICLEKLVTLFLAVLVLGLVPAVLARQKGRSFLGWWLYGSALFVVALIHALVVKPRVDRAPTKQRLDPANANPLPRLPKRYTFPVVGQMDVAAEILFRHGGAGSHEWHEVRVLGITGEEENGWTYIREVAVRERPGSQGGYIDFKQILEIRDDETGTSYRNWEEMAQYLRIRAGGINPGDETKIAEWNECRDRIIGEKVWREAHGNRGRRAFKPPLEAKIEAIDRTGVRRSCSVRVIAFTTFGAPFLIEAEETGTGRQIKPTLITFTLPGYHNPGLEAVMLTETGGETVADIAIWLGPRADRQRRERRMSKV